MKKITIIFAIVVLISIGAYFFINNKSITNLVPVNTDESSDITTDTADVSAVPNKAQNTIPEKVSQPVPGKSIIGTSVEGRPIEAETFGTGKTKILFVGGIHGGYEWNTVLLAYQFIDYLKTHPEIIPTKTQITVIPVLNPDGLYKVVGSAGRFEESSVPKEKETILGRFNANNVDLNRNFDCDWKETGVWQKKEVSGGTSPFSEPESKAIELYVKSNTPNAVVVWYSAAGGVYASSCQNGVLPETNTIMKLYADASTYPGFANFDFYETSGDMVNWFAKNNIPAISVLLSNHKDIEWDKNLKGIEAFLLHYK